MKVCIWHKWFAFGQKWFGQTQIWFAPGLWMVWDDVKVQWYYLWFGCFSICLSVLLLWHSALLKACLAVAPSLFMVCTRFDIGLHVLIKIGLALICTWFNCKVWHWFGLCLDLVLSQQARCGPPVPCCSPRPGQLRGEKWCKGHGMRQKIRHQNAFDQTRDRTHTSRMFSNALPTALIVPEE